MPAVARHEDDPKLLDRQPPYSGPGFRAALAAPQSGAASAAAGSLGFESNGVSLQSWLPLGELATGATQGANSGNDCWGYTSPQGREYALIGVSTGTAFVEITNPANAQIVATFAGPSSLWRDIKTYQNFAYAVSEGGSGIQVFDLANIDNGQVALANTITSGPGTLASHNVAIDEASGFLYRCGGDNWGLRIYSLANPAAPSFVGMWDAEYVHDAQIVTYDQGPYAGKQIAFVCSGANGGFTGTGIDVLDVTNKSNILRLGGEDWPDAAYSHQAWLSEDRQTLYVNDELDENGAIHTKTVVVDVADLSNPSITSVFFGDAPSVGHNLYTVGDRLFEANYRSGLQIFDISGPESPELIAGFDTYPDDDNAEFNGLWSVYPFFPSGTVIGSDIERGLFVWTLDDPGLQWSFPAGVPALASPTGSSFVAQITETQAGNLVAGSAKLVYDLGQGAQEVALTALGAGQFLVELPPVACNDQIEFYLKASSANGFEAQAKQAGENFCLVSAAAVQVVANYDMQAAAGWISGAAGDNATTGLWTRDDPRASGVQPEDDHSQSGTDCWFTGQAGIGESSGSNDVDGGQTTLTSPAFDLSGVPEAYISYWRWFANNGNTAIDDSLVVDITNGGPWVRVETVGPFGAGAQGGWLQHRFRVADFVAPGAAVRVRFIASDTGSGSIVEAAIDDFQVSSSACPALSGDLAQISLSAGGTQTLSLDAGPTAALEIYLLLGSITGTTPGLPIEGLLLPLNFDAYLTFTLGSPNKLPLSNSLGLLDANGAGTAAIQLAAGVAPQLAGQTLQHAFLTIDASQFTVEFVSNAMPLKLTP